MSHLKHVMVDLETLGRRAGCIIPAIGAVKFDPVTGEVDEANAFYRAVTVESCARFGLGFDPSTVKWWLGQSKEAQAVFNDPAAVGIQQALVEFAEWCDPDGEYGDIKMWGNGASFDNPILAAAYERVDIIQPWEFWNDRCYRTKKADYPEVKFVRKGVAHHALDDALSQAYHLCALYAKQYGLSGAAPE